MRLNVKELLLTMFMENFNIFVFHAQYLIYWLCIVVPPSV